MMGNAEFDARGGARMRISDDRYTRDRLRIDLAWRLIGHEARTFTIRQWTGLIPHASRLSH